MSSEGAGVTARRRGKEGAISNTSNIEDAMKLQEPLRQEKEEPVEVAQRKEEVIPPAETQMLPFLGELNPKWRNWWIRGMFSLVMFAGFAVVVYTGPVGLILLIQAIQIKCYHEIITIGHKKYTEKYNLPWFRTLSWYFLASANYFFYGENISEYLHGNGMPTTEDHETSEEVVRALFRYHRLISLSLYTLGFMLFVLSLRKNHYKVQFSLFGWTHVTLLIVVTQSHLIMQTMFEGLIWFFLPVSMVICNDIWAYIFGFFFGRTPLIKLSPKKTWEGFIGGGVATVIYGWLACYLMCQYQYLVCPIEYDRTSYHFDMSCEPSSLYVLTAYKVPAPVKYILGLVSVGQDQVWLYPMQLHSIVLSLFSSLIAPFGGFFASGFKRAFKVKDFGDTIPGHGGLVDRFDCQYLMATFVNVYHGTFIRALNPLKVLQQVFSLTPEQQVVVFKKLQSSLLRQGML